jgi:hypothetical protein
MAWSQLHLFLILLVGKKKLILKQFRCRWPILTIVETLADEVAEGVTLDELETFWFDALFNMFVNLRKTLALLIGCLKRRHLKHTHPKRIDVDASTILALEDLGSHEFGCANESLCIGIACKYS